MRFFTPFLLGLVASLPFIFALPNTKHRNTLSAAERVDPLLLQRFKLISQYAAAAYCFGNNDSTGTPVVCPEDNCPLVETANATSVYEFQNSGLTDTTGFIAVDDTNHLIVLSFRGSAEWKNWMANFQTVQIPFVFGVNFAEVHLGMLEAWKETEDGIVDNLMKAVKEHEDYQVVITGHSLGGGIATLAAVKLREKVPAELVCNHQAPPFRRVPLSANSHPNSANNGPARIVHFRRTQDWKPILRRSSPGFVGSKLPHHKLR